MLILKKGEILQFICQACNCEFVAGKNAVKNVDGNYYCKCPMCGADCHTDESKQKSPKAELEV